MQAQRIRTMPELAKVGKAISIGIDRRTMEFVQSTASLEKHGLLASSNPCIGHRPQR